MFHSSFAGNHPAGDEPKVSQYIPIHFTPFTACGQNVQIRYIMENLLMENVYRTIGHRMTDEEYRMLSGSMFRKSWDRKSILTEEGEVSRHVYFILKGACVSYYVNQQGDKNAIQFAVEGHWITDQYSYFSGKPGIYTVETLEPVEALVLNRENHEKICRSSHLFEHFFRVLVQNAFVALQYRLTKTTGEDAETRYLEFASLYPHFIQRIPQYLIASYLGIRPQSLSRIRKKLAASRSARNE